MPYPYCIYRYAAPHLLRLLLIDPLWFLLASLFPLIFDWLGTSSLFYAVAAIMPVVCSVAVTTHRASLNVCTTKEEEEREEREEEAEDGDGNFGPLSAGAGRRPPQLWGWP